MYINKSHRLFCLLPSSFLNFLFFFGLIFCFNLVLLFDILLCIFGESSKRRVSTNSSIIMELPIQFQQLSTKPTSHSFAHLLDPPTKLTIPNSPHQTNEFGKSSPTTPISSNAFLLNGSLEDKHRIQILEEQIRLLAGESSKAGMLIYSNPSHS